MTNLELNNYGVAELNREEMMNVDGGLSFPEWGAIVTTIIIVAYVLITLL